jgi:hypothetical protein
MAGGAATAVTGAAASLVLEPAVEIRRTLWARGLSVVEMLQAHLGIIERAS